jgi:rod shape-determining protein MreC
MRRLTRRQQLAAITLAVVALCLITLDVGGSSLASAHSGVRGTLGALYRGTDSLLGPVRRFVQGVPHAGSNEARIHDLEHQNAQLRSQLAQQSADKNSVAELNQLNLGAAQRHDTVVPARVIAFGPGAGFDWTVTLNVGSHNGVKAGMTVTDGAALVGRVLHADSSTSVVLLAVDPGSGVGGRVTRNNRLGVATGAGTGGFSFAPLAPTTTLQVGDVVMTGPAGSSSFVAGLTVGTVASVRTSGDGTVRARLTPSAEPTGLDLVGVILSSGSGAGLAGGR